MSTPPVPPVPEAAVPEQPDHVYLVTYPKIVFMYPTVLTSLFCSIFMWLRGGIPADEISIPPKVAAAVSASDGEMLSASVNFQADEKATPAAKSESAASDLKSESKAASPAAKAEKPQAASAGEKHTYHHWCARIFLLVFAMNLVVISFDFPRTTSLTWFFAICAVVIGLWFMFTMYENLAPAILKSLLSIKPAANASFYMIFTLVLLGLFVCVLVTRRFDYWEVKGNELLHHHGFLSNLERFSAPNLRIDKEINDLFEYMLLRSGRLIIHASNERRAIVLENVLNINAKEDQITRMLGALQVRVRTEKE